MEELTEELINKLSTYHWSIIVAHDLNLCIGKNNDMPWHLSSDLKRFKEITIGHPIVMGKNTYLSLPKKPLPGRLNIVLSKSLNLNQNNLITYPSWQNLSDNLQKDEEYFIIGGATIFKQAFPFTSKLYLTIIHSIFDCDTFLPDYNNIIKNWQKIEHSSNYDENGLIFHYETWTRNKL